MKNLLHKTRLQAFLDWAVEQGASIETPKGQWQKARFRFPGEPPHIIYDKLSDEHYSLEKRTVPVFWKFHLETRRGANP